MSSHNLGLASGGEFLRSWFVRPSMPVARLALHLPRWSLSCSIVNTLGDSSRASALISLKSRWIAAACARSLLQRGSHSSLLWLRS